MSKGAFHRGKFLSAKWVQCEVARPDHGEGPGYYGQCCGDVQCTETAAGRCPELDSPDLIGIDFPPGSGTCSCEPDEGLFARSEPNIEEGDCCYVIYSIGCDGRPLRRDGAVLVAEVVARTNWMGGAKLPRWAGRLEPSFGDASARKETIRDLRFL